MSDKKRPCEKAEGPSTKRRTGHPKKEIALNPEQQWVLDRILSTKENVFVTGGAGVGKSVVLKELVKQLNGNNIDVVAPTMSAAVNAGGITLHKFFGIGIHKDYESQLASAEKYGKANIIPGKVIIIDEISMVGSILDNMDRICKKIRKNHFSSMGGIRVIAFGDFHQLPPISNDDEGPIECYAFETSFWKNSMNLAFELCNPMRQQDEDFYRVLNSIRVGEISDEVCQFIESLDRPAPLLEELVSASVPGSLKQDGAGAPKGIGSKDITPTYIFSRVKDVEKMNRDNFVKLASPIKTYKAKDRIMTNWTPNWPVPESIQLRVGARVILTRNLSPRLYNGSAGTVVSIDGEWPEILFDNGKRKIIEPVDYEIHLKKKLIACRNMIPLDLGYARTIHKAQGLSIDLLVVDLNGVFACGQVYVALSRATSVRGLRVKNFKRHAVKTDQRVLDFYKSANIHRFPSPVLEN